MFLNGHGIRGRDARGEREAFEDDGKDEAGHEGGDEHEHHAERRDAAEIAAKVDDGHVDRGRIENRRQQPEQDDRVRHLGGRPRDEAEAEPDEDENQRRRDAELLTERASGHDRHERNHAEEGEFGDPEGERRRFHALSLLRAVPATQYQPTVSECSHAPHGVP